MIVAPVKTKKIVVGDDLYKILDESLSKLEEKSVVAVTSKIVSICEGRVAQDESEELRDTLARREAEYFLPREENRYDVMVSITKGIMVASAGIDRSNANGYLVLWPEDPQKSVNAIRDYLVNKFHLTYLGVIITDSKLAPLRWGVTGISLAHAGFRALNSYIGKPDIFGRLMHAEKANVADSLATAAVAEMGEGDEQQPLAVITDANFVHFQKRNPSQKELDNLTIALGDDIYSSLLTSVAWKKGRGGNA